jgi:hypothetical protein
MGALPGDRVKPKALAALFPAQPAWLGTTGGAAVRSKAAEKR